MTTKSSSYVFDVPGYEELADALVEAYHQAARGKGQERHGLGKPFMDNPIMKEVRELGPASLVYQVRKKSREAMNLPLHMAKNEMLGSMIYSAALYLYYNELEKEKGNVQPGLPADEQLQQV